jgi:uncharacterized membrane protein YdfJ with MMPL/SSD domain
MFAKLGDFIVRAWPAVLIAWVAAVVCVSIITPGLDSVAKTAEFSFLPSDSKSHIAEELYREAFPNGYCPSRIVVIARREEGITLQDREFMTTLMKMNSPIAIPPVSLSYASTLPNSRKKTRWNIRSQATPSFPIFARFRNRELENFSKAPTAKPF